MSAGRIEAAFQRGERDGRPLFIPFLTAGYPHPSETVDLVLAAEEGGADLIEVGLPFSDPLADGPTIQAASQRALEQGMTHRKTLDLVAEVRRKSEVPLVLMGCYNPLFHFGLEKFFNVMSEAGADAMIISDLPLEESDGARGAAAGAGVGLVFLIAPTTPPERIGVLDAASTYFSYCVSLTGVTGARDELDPGLAAYLKRVAARARKPFVVGFGISQPAQCDRLSPPAAGVVVGSALIRAIGEAASAADRRRVVRDFTARFRRR